MADELRMALDSLLRKADVAGDVDFLREGARVFSEALMELEVTWHVGAEQTWPHDPGSCSISLIKK